jgi:hypothetical protein
MPTSSKGSRRGEASADNQASANPELIEQHVPERVVLVVADARAEHRHRAQVVHGQPRGVVDELVLDPAPELTCRGGVARLQRRGPGGLRVDPPVAELGDVEVVRAVRHEGTPGPRTETM